MGRRKIEMKMVKDSSSRQVTFSKRRTGLFKKANELGILCGVELAILVFSPGSRLFSFGHPNVDAVAHRFLHHHEAQPDCGSSSAAGENAEKLSQQLKNVMKQMEAEKNKGEILDKAFHEKKMVCIGDGLDLEKLQKLKRSLEQLRDGVKLRVREMEASSSLLLLAEKPMVPKEFE